MAEESKDYSTSNDPVPFEEHTKVMQELQRTTERAQRFEGQIAEFQSKLKQFEGIDLEALKAKSTELELLKRDQAAGNPEEIEKLWKEKEQAIRSEAAQQIEEWKGKYQQVTSSLHELQVVDKTMSTLGGMFNDDVHDFVKDLVRKSVGRDEQGNFFIKDDEGKPVYGSDQKPLTIESWGNQLAQKYPSMARVKAKSGAMADGLKGSGGATMSAEQWLNLSPAERQQYPSDYRQKMSQLSLKALK